MLNFDLSYLKVHPSKILKIHKYSIHKIAKMKASFSIKSSINSHSSLLKSYLLVLHSWTGCDTTSAIHMKGKTSLIKKIETSLQVRQMLDTLRDPNADQLEVGAAGIELFLQMYNGKGSLASLRYVISYTYQHSNNTVHK